MDEGASIKAKRVFPKHQADGSEALMMARDLF